MSKQHAVHTPEQLSKEHFTLWPVGCSIGGEKGIMPTVDLEMFHQRDKVRHKEAEPEDATQLCCPSSL